MSELLLYEDSELSREVKGEHTFEPVLAGQTTRKSLYIKNTLDYPVEFKIALSGDVNESFSGKVEAKGVTDIGFSVSPDKLARKPLKAQLKIRFEYVII